MNFTFDKVFERVSNTIYEYEFRHSVEIISNDDDPVYKVDENKATDLSEILRNQFEMQRFQFKSQGFTFVLSNCNRIFKY